MFNVNTMMSHLVSRGPDSGRPIGEHALIAEAWIEGFLLGALIIMCCITISNMRKELLLHKLILLELLLGIPSGFPIFNNATNYGWYISATGTLMYITYGVHNVVAWMKIRPFLKRPASLFFILTVVLVQPYWVLESYANFEFFNGNNMKLFGRTRVLEAAFRDPWWVWTTVALFYNLKTRYDLTFMEMLRISPRFIILLIAMCVSICFVILDILANTTVFNGPFLTGINPFWKLTFIFKCLTDSVILDDFKSVLDKLYQAKLRRIRGSVVSDPYHEHNEMPPSVSIARRRSTSEPSAEHINKIETREVYSLSSTTKNNGGPRDNSPKTPQSIREVV